MVMGLSITILYLVLLLSIFGSFQSFLLLLITFNTVYTSGTYFRFSAMCQCSYMKQSEPHETKAMLVQFSSSVSRAKANKKEELSHTIRAPLLTN